LGETLLLYPKVGRGHMHAPTLVKFLFYILRRHGSLGAKGVLHDEIDLL
jgi:hypothetical protein